MAASRERFIRAYVNAYTHAAGMVAIYVAASSTSGPALIGITKNTTEICGRYQTGTTYVRWCDRHFAKRIVDSCRDQLVSEGTMICDGGALAIDPMFAAKALAIVAIGFGVTLIPDADMQARAEARVRTVELETERLKLNGGLNDLNGRYREYRLARKAEGRSAQRYAAFLWNWKMSMVKAAAEQAALAVIAVRAVPSRARREGASDQIAEEA
jgi:hypothetical protein